MPEPYFSVEAAVTAAEQAHEEGRYGDAESYLRQLLGQTRAADYEYDEWLRRLAAVYGLQRRGREQGLLQIYLHYYDLARLALPTDAHRERALCFALEKRWPEAAGECLAAGQPVQAAIAYEEARDPAQARDAWASLIGDARLRDRPYERALVHFNLGLALGRLAAAAPDERAAERAESVRHLVAAQRLLEQVADDYETAGERERAFDCYQILLKLGHDAGSFENLSEGYLNCIRILKEDGLKFYVLQYYEDFLELALARQEFHAAATLYKEAAEYALRAGLPYHRHYLGRSGATWWREAERATAGGAPAELVENAYLASVECFSGVGDFVRVRESYERLGKLDLGDRKRARYTAIAGRYHDAPREEVYSPELPQYLRQPRAYGDIWFVDLVEWEHDGDPERVAAAMVGDLRYPDSIRRRALNLILDLEAARTAASIGIAAQPGVVAVEVLTKVAQGLGELQSYAALSPLERLYEHRDAGVRRAAVRALRHLYFKRSFNLLQRALADSDAPVREAAVEAMRSLHFPHAFHPLLKIYRGHPDERVKTVALESIGRIASIVAGELLISVLREETGALREVAYRALNQFDHEDIAPILAQQLELEANPDVARLLKQLVERPRKR